MITLGNSIVERPDGLGATVSANALPHGYELTVDTRESDVNSLQMSFNSDETSAEFGVNVQIRTQSASRHKYDRFLTPPDATVDINGTNGDAYRLTPFQYRVRFMVTSTSQATVDVWTSDDTAGIERAAEIARSLREVDQATWNQALTAAASGG